MTPRNVCGVESNIKRDTGSLALQALFYCGCYRILIRGYLFGVNAELRLRRGHPDLAVEETKIALTKAKRATFLIETSPAAVARVTH